jgi:putative transcriptional regulator
MVRINLAILLAKKKWKQSDLCRITGIRYMTINDLYHELAEKIRFDHLETICEVLECKIDELIEIVPKKNSRQ